MGASNAASLAGVPYHVSLCTSMGQLVFDHGPRRKGWNFCAMFLSFSRKSQDVPRGGVDAILIHCVTLCVGAHMGTRWVHGALWGTGCWGMQGVCGRTGTLLPQLFHPMLLVWERDARRIQCESGLSKWKRRRLAQRVSASAVDRAGRVG